jgi:hypothetical protein
MVAILNRCHGCGNQLLDSDKFCSRCGVERSKPTEAALEAMNPQPPGGMAWSYRIPLLNNKFTWIRWGWTAFWSGLGLSLPLTALILAMFGEFSGDGAVFALKLFLVIAAIPAGTVLVVGLFAALISGNGIASRTTLTPQGCVVSIKEEGVTGAVENVAFLLGSKYQSAREAGGAAAILLPNEGDTEWGKVAKVEFDPRRRVITLRRRWHNPLRLYAPGERFPEAVRYVREHVPASAIPTPRPGGGSGRPVGRVA